MATKKKKMTLSELADLLDVDVVFRRHANPSFPFVCSFDRSVEVKTHKKSAMLTSEFGRGRSLKEAMRDYARNIRGKVLVQNATSKTERREYQVPNDLVAA